MDAEQIEREYLDFCLAVKDEAIRIMAMALKGRDKDALACAALTLSDTANARAHQYRMQKERTAPNRFDLAALGVDATVPSDSETGYEDRG